MTLEEKSFKVLELQAVLKLLADEAVSDGAKLAAEGLRPVKDIHQARQLLSETTAAKDMMVLKGSPGDV